MMTEDALRSDLSNLIARHASWLDGRTFQRVVLDLAETYFTDDDCDSFVDIEGFAEGLGAALEKAFAGNPVGTSAKVE